MIEGININDYDYDGRTALSLAASEGNLECVIINDFWDVYQLIKDSDQRRLLTQALRQFVIYSRKQGQQGSYFTLS